MAKVKLNLKRLVRSKKVKRWRLADLESKKDRFSESSTGGSIKA
jgi:hypothetical protein